MLLSREDRRKRPRIERESEGLFSFFRRSREPHYNNAIAEPDGSCIDIVDLNLHRVAAHGVSDRTNDLFIRVARTTAATANVVFFPGDVQDDHNAMSNGPYAEFAGYSYEASTTLLTDKFGDNANVWVVRPSRFQFGAYTCFDNFVETNKFGAATAYSSTGSAVEQLMALMEDARAQLQEQQVEVSTVLPIHLVGFSKGGVVLNQLVTEIAAQLHPEQSDDDENNNNNNSGDPDGDHDHEMVPTRHQQLADLLASIHWLDSGNGSQEGAVPTDNETLAGLSTIRSLQLIVHVTPYQIDASDRPWIKQEVLRFISGMKRHGVAVRMQRYLDEEPASLSAHFRILREFQLSLTNRKTGHRTHSPEVTVQPYPIQTHA